MMVFSIGKEYSAKQIKYLLYKEGISRAAVTKLKSSPDGIMLNGERVTVRHILNEGDILELSVCEKVNPDIVPCEMKLDIVYEDDDIIAVNKPRGMPTHPSIRHFEGTLANGLCYYFSQKGMPFVFRAINRLDADTDGIILVAKNKFAANRYTKLLADGKIKKTYIAVLNGVPPEKGRIEAPIRRKQDSIILRETCDINAQGAKQSVTEYERILTDGKASVVRAYPLTGRTHQLRVHFAHIGCPLAGDAFYGSAETVPTEYDKMLSRHALHADSLEIEGERTFKAGLPSDMKAVIERIGENNG